MTKKIVRVCRGSCRFLSAWVCRSVFRGGYEPIDQGDYLGFRPAFRLKRIKR